MLIKQESYQPQTFAQTFEINIELILPSKLFFTIQKKIDLQHTKNKKMKIQTTQRKLFTVTALSIGAIMFAQEQDSLKTKTIDDVVITGNANPKASIKTSTSISTLKMKEIVNAAPRTTAEIFRTIPGIRSESSGGEGNSNITVRGVPAVSYTHLDVYKRQKFYFGNHFIMNFSFKTFCLFL